MNLKTIKGNNPSKPFSDCHVHLFIKGQAKHMLANQESEGPRNFTGLDDFLMKTYYRDARALGIENIRPVTLLVAKNNDRIPELNHFGLETNPLSFITLRPDMPHMDTEIQWAKQNNIPGVKIVCFSQDFLLLDPKTIDMFHKIQEADLSVLLHASSILEAQFWKPNYAVTPRMLKLVMDAVPGLKVLFAHAGGGVGYKDQIAELVQSHPNNVYYDLACLYYFSIKNPLFHPLLKTAFENNEFDKFLDEHKNNAFDMDGIKEILEIIGFNRLCFGSDWPYHSLKNILLFLEELGITPEKTPGIFYDNFPRFIGLPGS